ncbi:unnamed protein product [Closterium sp. NIES-64]|nr:unnamed protein product [Closterium sp. NIES-64]
MTSLLAPHSAVPAAVGCAAAHRTAVRSASGASQPLSGHKLVTSTNTLQGRLRRRSSSLRRPSSTFPVADSTRNVVLAASSSSSSTSEAVLSSSTIPCPDCSGQGWLQCEVCQGERVNVKVNKRLFRRCPGCYALGMTLCQKCKVYKCVTFPDGVDGGAVDD